MNHRERAIWQRRAIKHAELERLLVRIKVQLSFLLLGIVILAVALAWCLSGSG